MRFLRRIDLARVLSFHQPLNGVDTDTKDPRFARRLARALRLPPTTLDCGGLCHGTMTSWFNARFAGAALTVEYAARPPRHRLTSRRHASSWACSAPTAPLTDRAPERVRGSASGCSTRQSAD